MELCRKHAVGPVAEASLLMLLVLSVLAVWPRQASPTAVDFQSFEQAGDAAPAPGKLDFSAHARTGVASFYASQFFWRKMADGAPMDPHGNNAASRTLPLGTVARVTDVETGRSAIVKIEDRGPYVGGRIVDLSPTTARMIGITARQGLARVVVKPIAVPLPGGGMKLDTDAQESDLRLATAMASARPLR